jgi:ABC-type transporter Mla subunit MlaD
MMSVLDWIANLILAALLVGTLVMAFRLDRALAVVRRDRAVFETLISNLASATSSVKAGIQALRNEADRAAEQIERRSEHADKLATDLSFLIDAANRASQRLEENRQAAEPATPRPSRTEAKRPAEPAKPQAGGLRELVGIAQRRRVRNTGVSVRQAEPKPADAAPADSAFVAMEG